MEILQRQATVQYFFRRRSENPAKAHLDISSNSMEDPHRLGSFKKNPLWLRRVPRWSSYHYQKRPGRPFDRYDSSTVFSLIHNNNGFIYRDNEQTHSLVESIKHPRLITRLKHIDIHSCWLRQESSAKKDYHWLDSQQPTRRLGQDCSLCLVRYANIEFSTDALRGTREAPNRSCASLLASLAPANGLTKLETSKSRQTHRYGRYQTPHYLVYS